MTKHKQYLLMILVIVCQGGCNQSKPAQLPAFQPITRITASVKLPARFGIDPVDFIEVPEEQISAFSKLITPTSPCEIDLDDNYQVASLTIHHPSGAKTSLTVRWTGHNAAAISLDDKNFYYGGIDEFPDGATRIVRLLHEFDSKARQTSK